MPLTVVTVDAPSRSTRARAWGAASCAPPPSTTSGRRAPRKSSAAAAMASAAGPGRATGATLCLRYVIGGRGDDVQRQFDVHRPRPGAVNTAKARASTSGNSSGRSRVWLNAVRPAIRLRWEGNSCSRPSPSPSSWLLLTLEITSSGTESA